MSQDLDCGCAVGTFTGFPHYLCERHLKLERDLGLNPLFPADHPLEGCEPYNGPDPEMVKWLDVYPIGT